MRAVAIVSLVVVALALCAAYVQAAPSSCSKAFSCSTCFNSTGGSSCGWCSDTNLCMNGGQFGPTGTGSCKNWHRNCVGVSIPVTHPCSGSPITQTALRRLMGGAGTTAYLTNGTAWNYQTRSCSAFTGCTDWTRTTDSTLGPVTVALRVANNALWLNFITGWCSYSTCYDSNTQVPDFGSSYGDKRVGYGLATKVDMSSITQSLPDSSLPYMLCSGSSCNGRAALGKTWKWEVTLSDSCFRLASNIGNDPEDPTKQAYIELTGPITYP